MTRLRQSKRQNIGIISSTRVRGIHAHSGIKQQQGGGILDVIRGIMEAGKTVKKGIDFGKKAIDFATGETGTAIRNIIPASDQNARPGFVGEQHAVLKLPNGLPGVANWLGPGTQIAKRIERGDPARTLSDKVAQGHDLRYFLAKDVNDVRRADNIMVNKLKQIKRTRGDSSVNVNMGLRAIQAKIMAEDSGLLSRDAFSGDLSKNITTPETKAKMVGKLAELQQQGFGMPPGHQMKMDILKKLARQKKKKKKKTLAGGCNKCPLKGSGIKRYVVNKIIPTLLKITHTPSKYLSKKVAVKVIDKAYKMSKKGDIKSLASNLGKSILPLIGIAKIKQKGGQVGSGVVKNILKSPLLKPLRIGLAKALKDFLKKNKKERIVLLKGSGVSLAGSGFFSDFAKGFATGFGKTISIGAPILSLLGPKGVVAGTVLGSAGKEIAKHGI